MGYLINEEGGNVWQCSKHDVSKRRFPRGDGVCPFCLHERLSSLCPDCAHDLPCPCIPRASVSISPSSSLFNHSAAGAGGSVSFAGIGSVGRVSSLIDCEPAFRRSKSIAIPLFWSAKPDLVEPDRARATSSFWRLLRGNRGETKTTIMKKSRSVAVSDAGESRHSPAPVTEKGKGWYFPSPIKVFRQSRVSKMMFQQSSPLYRG